jgi:hypothetical protein
MKTLRCSTLCLVTLLFTAPLLCAQDLSKYRDFTLGMSLTDLLKRTDQKMIDVKTIQSRPTLIQELTWWPPTASGVSPRSDSVERVLFSLNRGELYKISVTYDRLSTEGLTQEDMVKSISAKYGPATIPAPELEAERNGRYEYSRDKTVASWEDAQYSVSLVRSSFNDVLGLVALSKRTNAAAEAAIAEGAKLDQQEGPQREADRVKKQLDDLQMAREKNQKSFRP